MKQKLFFISLLTVALSLPLHAQVEQNDSIAFHLYLQMAEKDDNPDAMIALAHLYEIQSEAVEDNNEKLSDKLEKKAEKWYEKAFKIYHKAAKKGDAKSMLALYKLYASGEGVEKDDELAREWLQKSAEQNYVDALYTIGSHYRNGTFGYPKKQARAIEWFTLASNQGDDKAALQLGKIYSGNKNLTQAADWYEVASQRGNAEAQYLLGLAYLRGEGVSQNDEKTAHWLTLSSEQNYKEAQIILANFLFGKKSYRNALQWFQAYNPQQHNLLEGNCYWNLQQYDSAIAIFETQPTGLDSTTLMLLARAYEAGDPLPHDEQKSAFWYELAADSTHSDNHEAQYQMGLRYLNGNGVTKDLSKAIGYWSWADRKGDHSMAQLRLGDCYHEGTGVEKDDQTAASLWSKAAQKGNVEALLKMANCYLNGIGVDTSYQQAFSCNDRVLKADTNNLQALLFLGEAHLYGSGTAADTAYGLTLLRRAAAQGSATAEYFMAKFYYNIGYNTQNLNKSKDLATTALSNSSLPLTDPYLAQARDLATVLIPARELFLTKPLYPAKRKVTNKVQGMLSGQFSVGKDKVVAFSQSNHSGKKASPWRALTDEEWRYLLGGDAIHAQLPESLTPDIDYSLTLQYGDGAFRSTRWGLGTVDNAKGIILLPDHWTLPKDLHFTAHGLHSANTYTAAQWKLMEKNGAVFLPFPDNVNDIDDFTGFSARLVRDL